MQSQPVILVPAVKGVDVSLECDFILVALDTIQSFNVISKLPTIAVNAIQGLAGVQ